MIDEYIRGLLGHDIELKAGSYDSTKGKLVDISADGEWAVIEKRHEVRFIGFYSHTVQFIHRDRSCARCTAERYLPATSEPKLQRNT